MIIFESSNLMAFPFWVTIVATFISISIIFALVTYFVYYPVKNSINSRQDFIKNNIDDSIEKNKKADTRLQESENYIKESLSKKEEILEKANKEAQQIKQQAISDSFEEIEQIKNNLETISKNEKEKLEKEYTNKVIEAAMEISIKVLEEQFDNIEIDDEQLLKTIENSLEENV